MVVDSESALTCETHFSPPRSETNVSARRDLFESELWVVGWFIAKKPGFQVCLDGFRRLAQIGVSYSTKLKFCYLSSLIRGKLASGIAEGVLTAECGRPCSTSFCLFSSA